MDLIIRKQKILKLSLKVNIKNRLSKYLDGIMGVSDRIYTSSWKKFDPQKNQKI